MAVPEPMKVYERYKLYRGVKPYYHRADREMKGHLLDLLVEMTGQHRKYVIALMNARDPHPRTRTRQRGRTYKEDVDQAIRTVGDTLDWICAERIKPVLVQMAEHLAKFDEMETSPQLLHQLGEISTSTLRRRLHSLRPPDARLPRIHRKPRPETSIQSQVPVRVIPWDEPEAGHFEVDLVQHGAPDPEHTLVYTIQFIDVLTGWSERFAMLGHDFGSMWRAFQAFRERCPIPVREVHTDNGSEFLNEALLAHFHDAFTGSLFSRGEPGHCNHNRFVEQKNDTLVRAYLGDLRLTNRHQVSLLNEMYATMWFYYNAFQPVMRQVEKTAEKRPEGTYRVVRKHDTPATPLTRLVKAKPPLSRPISERLLQRFEKTNPRALNQQIHAQLDRIYSLALDDQRKEEAGR